MKHRDTVKRNRFYHCLEYDHDQKGALCLVASGMERCDPGVHYGPDLRDCWHLHAVSDGTGTLRVGDQVFHPHAGQLFLLKDNEAAEYTADKHNPWVYCWVTYNGSEAGQMTEELGFTEGIYVLDSTLEMGRFFDLVLRIHEKPEMNYVGDLYRRGVLMQFLSLTMESTQTPAQRMERRNEYSPQMYVRRSVDFIHYNYATISVTDIVEYVGFTRSYFSSQFRKYMGVSPQEYLMNYRMEQSCRLLRETSLPMQEVGKRVGYQDPLNFSRAFKRAKGLSPTDYRNRAKGASTP